MASIRGDAVTKRKAKKSADVDVSHAIPDLIAPGLYEWQVIRVDVNKRFMNVRKAFIRGQIMSEGPYHGVELYMACSLPDRPGVRSKYVESWIVANWGNRPRNKERLSTRLFKNAIFKVEVRTVAKDEKGNLKMAALHYSVVDRLIERVA
jgi:hypothetical protein